MGAKVSICIPCYNNADEVERLLASVYSQDFTDFEVNLSDDSTDNKTARLVRDRFPGVNYQHNEKPRGHILNWNEAIRMAAGEYIKVMFSDDWFTDSTSLGQFAAMLDNAPQAMLAFSGSRQVMLDGQGMRNVQPAARENDGEVYDRCAPEEYVERLRSDYRILFMSNQIGAPSATIYRRGDSLTLFDEESNWASDVFLYFELFRKNRQFACTKKPLVSIGVHGRQYTESFAERDMRIYNDYRYMYTKYRLRESPECREHFTEKFIIKYHQGLREARALGIGSGMYWKKWFAQQWETIRCFIGARIKKLPENRRFFM